MKLAFAVSVAWLVCSAASADLIWDNYLSTSPVNPTEWYDGVYALSSERTTLVTNSWTGDDAIFDSSLTLTGLSWYGLLEKRDGTDYSSADVVVYLRNPDQAGHPITPGDLPVAAFTDLSFSRRDIVDTSFDGGGKQYQVYEGTVNLPEGVDLTAGHYYYSVRVTDGGLGRAYVLTTGNGQTNPNPNDTIGVFQSSFLYYPDRPNWVYDDQASTHASDYAYRLYGYVPEPASLLLIALGALACRRR